MSKQQQQYGHHWQTACTLASPSPWILQWIHWPSLLQSTQNVYVNRPNQLSWDNSRQLCTSIPESSRSITNVLGTSHLSRYDVVLGTSHLPCYTFKSGAATSVITLIRNMGFQWTRFSSQLNQTTVSNGTSSSTLTTTCPYTRSTTNQRNQSKEPQATLSNWLPSSISPARFSPAGFFNMLPHVMHIHSLRLAPHCLAFS